jgi:hypothetical protein
MINKKDFIFVLSQIELQIEKERNFVKFLQDGNYIDGHVASSFSEPLLDVTIKLLSSFFEDNVFIKKDDDWLGWFAYENDFGKMKMSCFYDDKEYVITNSEGMYNFLILLKENNNE